MKNYGMKFLRFVDRRRSATELGQPQTSLVQCYEALWHFFHEKLSKELARSAKRNRMGHGDLPRLDLSMLLPPLVQHLLAALSALVWLWE